MFTCLTQAAVTRWKLCWWEPSSVSLLTSNFIITPFSQVCEDEDGEWASIDELYQQYQAVEGKYLSSPQLWQLSSPMRRPPQPLDKIDLIVETELVIYGKPHPVRQYMCKARLYLLTQMGLLHFAMLCLRAVQFFQLRQSAKMAAKNRRWCL